jgi:hypothetical protein
MIAVAGTGCCKHGSPFQAGSIGQVRRSFWSGSGHPPITDLSFDGFGTDGL